MSTALAQRAGFVHDRRVAALAGAAMTALFVSQGAMVEFDQRGNIASNHQLFCSVQYQRATREQLYIEAANTTRQPAEYLGGGGRPVAASIIFLVEDQHVRAHLVKVGYMRYTDGRGKRAAFAGVDCFFSSRYGRRWSDSCKGLSAHGFRGLDRKVVDTIISWLGNMAEEMPRTSR